ncbi:helix-turn-helix domain-containing protein [Dyadobacter sp. NIV53]|uniref:winged helix-turn-helix transcriptional regulator n=1 Tax=Dyadobacter sp. NIV53 TaxID=2861765 RepID=UPI001C86B037|nr:helix-turn-helix domain-containing protein [Dyadobacter sp. NIV53]
MEKLNHKECTSQLLPIRDAIDVISGKWKLQIIVSISTGNNHFREIERSIPKLSSKVLAKELKDLEANRLIKRTVFESSPVSVEYTLLPHADSLQPVIESLRHWGTIHRNEIMRD